MLVELLSSNSEIVSYDICVVYIILINTGEPTASTVKALTRATGPLPHVKLRVLALAYAIAFDS